MLIISDIHGCYWTLRRLLRKCPDEPLVFAGDLVDRGPYSREVVEFAMRERVPTVLGNHDHMMLAYLQRTQAYSETDWTFNGGLQTLASWNDVIPEEVVAWFEQLPLYLQHGSLLVSHTGHGLMAEADLITALWEREFAFPDDGLYRVFGHTRQREAVVTKTYACIDTGAAYGGKLTALRWPSMTLYQQPYDESALT